MNVIENPKREKCILLEPIPKEDQFSSVTFPLTRQLAEDGSYTWKIHQIHLLRQKVLKIGTPLANLTGQQIYWLDWCQYLVNGCDEKFDLQLLSQCGSVCNCVSRSVLRCTTLLLGRQAAIQRHPRFKGPPSLFRGYVLLLCRVALTCIKISLT